MHLTQNDLDKFFNPKSIALVGVSRSGWKFGGLSFLRKYLQAGSIAGNPLDLWLTFSNPAIFVEVIDLVDKDPSVGMILADRLIARAAFHMPDEPDPTPATIARKTKRQKTNCICSGRRRRRSRAGCPRRYCACSLRRGGLCSLPHHRPCRQSTGPNLSLLSSKGCKKLS